jgi:hypothetical protein
MVDRNLPKVSIRFERLSIEFLLVDETMPKVSTRFERFLVEFPLVEFLLVDEKSA